MFASRFKHAGHDTGPKLLRIHVLECFCCTRYIWSSGWCGVPAHSIPDEGTHRSHAVSSISKAHLAPASGRLRSGMNGARGIAASGGHARAAAHLSSAMNSCVDPKSLPPGAATSLHRRRQVLTMGAWNQKHEELHGGPPRSIMRQTLSTSRAEDLHLLGRRVRGSLPCCCRVWPQEWR